MSRAISVGKDVKKYILSFNYCVENLENTGFYDRWFENFWTNTFSKLVSIPIFYVINEDQTVYSDTKNFYKDSLKRRINEIEDRFVKEQENWSDTLTTEDLEVMYKNSYSYKSPAFLGLREEDEENPGFYFDFKNARLLEYTEIYSAIKELITECKKMYNMRKKKYVPKIESDPDPNIDDDDWYAIKEKDGEHKYSRINYKGIIIQTDASPIDNVINIHGKIVNGGLYPLTNEDLKIIGKNKIPPKTDNIYKYRGKIVYNPEEEEEDEEEKEEDE